LPTDDIFVQGDLLTLETIIGVMNEVVSSDCPAEDGPPPYVDSIGDGNNKRVKSQGVDLESPTSGHRKQYKPPLA
jgi:hypothetical protein